jgi:hypothetical protein
MIGTRVFVYRNLHKKCYSVKCMKTHLVIAHVDNIELIGAVFKVSESGRQRVLKEKRKNVHAGVVGVVKSFGVLSTFNPHGITTLERVTYNPYRFDSFIYKNNELPIYKARTAYLDTTGIQVI